METTNQFIQWLMDAERSEVISKFIEIDQNFNRIYQHSEATKKKLESAEFELRSAKRDTQSHNETIEIVKKDVSRIIHRVQAIIDVKFPEHNSQPIDQYYDQSQFKPIEIPEELRILEMICSDLDNIGNDIPF